MKIGLYLNSQYPAAEDAGAALELLKEQTRAAARLGFDSIWAGEHHITHGYHFFPQLTLLSHLAAYAGDMTLGTNLVLLPLHRPVDIAEQVAMIDQACGGRFILTVGQGYREEEFVAFGVPFAEWLPRMVDGIDGSAGCGRARRSPTTPAGTRSPTLAERYRYDRCTYAGMGPRPPAGHVSNGGLPMDEERFETGKAARGRVLGEQYVTSALDGADSFNRDFQEMVTEYCWGEIWGRTVLSDKQRSLNNLCILAALNRPKEFKLHFKGAIGNGATLDELRDTLMQIAVYAGIPAGVEAFRLGREVLEAEGIVPPEAPTS